MKLLTAGLLAWVTPAIAQFLNNTNSFVSFNGGAMAGPNGKTILSAQYFDAGTTPNYGTHKSMMYQISGKVLTGDVPVYGKFHSLV
jgi:hypothetical protein